MKQSRWFILALCFLLLNGFAVFRWLETLNQPRKVKVVLSAPENGGVPSRSRDELYWHFSADMVPTNRVGHWQEQGPVLFSPEIKGEFCWTKPNELAFRPAAIWPACSLFSAIFADGLRALDGRPLDENRTSAFRSDPLTLPAVRQSNVVGAGSVQLDFEFSEPVRLPMLWKHLEVTDADGKPVEVIRSGNHSAHRTLRVRLGRVKEGRLQVTVRKGLVSSAGPLGLEEDESRSVQISRELRVLQVATQRPSFKGGCINLTLNAPVDPATAKEFIRIEPELDFSVERRNGWGGLQYLRMLGDFQPGQSYTLTFCKGMKSSQDVHLEKDDVRKIYFPWYSSMVEFSARGIYLSTQGGLSVPFKAVNTGKCSVKINRVYPNNLVQLVLRKAGRVSSYYGSPFQGLDQSVADFEVPIDAPANEVIEGCLKLREQLDGKTGAFHIQIRGERGGYSTHDLVVSDLGISLRKSDKDILVWLNSIRTLDPVEGAAVQILSEENQVLLRGVTDREGLLRLDPAAMPAEGKPFLLVVEKDDDLTYMRLDNSRVNLQGAVGDRAFLESGYEAFLFTDRGIYRPDETIQCKAIVRDRKAACPQPFPVALSVIRPDGKVDRVLNEMLGEFGTAEFSVALADYVATGKYRLQLGVPGGETPFSEITVAVEEFVPPQIRTSLRIPEGRIAAGRDWSFKVVGQHLFGRAAADLPVSARVDFIPCTFAPKAWSDYAFGDARRKFETVQKALGKKQLDVHGEMEFSPVASASWRPPAAIKAVVSGTVQETGGRTVTDYGSRIVDVYPSYIGIQRLEESLEIGTAHTFDLALVAPDGSLVETNGALKTTIEKLNWVTVMQKEGDHYAYRSEQQVSEIKSHEVVVSNGTAFVGFDPTHAGQYRLVVENASNRTASTMEFRVHAAGQRWSERSMSAPDVVELELDQESYLVGDQARLSIRSPFSGKALLTLESDEVLQYRVVELTNNTAEIELPVMTAYRPNVYCSVSVVRAVLPEEVWGQHRAAGRIPLVVRQPEKKLSISLDLPEEMRPGTRLEIPVQVNNAEGAGCRSEIVLAAVDEGICMLTGFETPDPYDYFFGARQPGVVMHDLYAQLMPESLDQVAGAPSAPGGGMLAAISKRLNPIKARRFKPVALWSSSVQADTNGQAVVVFDVPEFTGQLRVMAVALDQVRFGSAAASVLVKRPLVVQSSLPRFLAPEDTFVMPVRIFNETEQAGEVTVEVGSEGPLQCLEKTFSVMVEAGATTNLEFQLQALPVPGKAVCLLTAEMGAEQYAESVEIAVRPAAPLAVYSGVGTVPPGEEAEVQVPAEWLAGTGEASVWLSALPSVKLGASLDYLLGYPYGCLEQTTSKSFPLLYLADLAEQTQPGSLGAGGTTEFVNAGIYRILSMQKGNGGFSLWPNRSIYDWGSIYATHFLVEASKAGYDVPKDRLAEALNFVEKKIRNASFASNGWNYNLSYGCYVLALGGKPQHGSVARMCEKWDELRNDTRINLISARLATGQRRQALELLNSFSGASLHPIPRETGGSLRSAVRGNAFLLSVMMDVDPDSNNVPELVQRLEAAQSNGRWYHTQDNAVALMALGKYTKRMAEKQKPLSGQVSWNGGEQSVEFKDREELLTALDGLSGKTVRLQNRGEGMMYFCWQSEGVPSDGRVEERDLRIKLRRTLLDLNNQPVDPMELKQGELYIVRLDLLSQDPVQNLVIEDLLPAGLEVENSVLKTAQKVRWVRKQQTLSMEHVDIRDDRVIAFPGNVYGGKSYCYAVRAVTTGEFVWPAISSVCMYDASIGSIHGRGRIRVTEK